MSDRQSGSAGGGDGGGGGSPLALSPDEMRRLGYRVVDRVVERWASLAESPVSGMAGREATEERLREPVPERGGDADEVLARFWSDVEPLAGKIDHPRFYAFIPSSPSFGSVLGDWLTAGCNFFQGTWIESPGPSQVELVVLDWLKESLGYPGDADGIFTSGGSAANLMGLAAAREDRLGGVPGDGVAYCSDQTHTAVDRALRILGFPEGRLRRLPSDAAWRLDPGAVADAVERDRARGLTPFCVVANAGTTNTGAVDPLPELAELCESQGLWLHADGAYGAFARLAREASPTGRREAAKLEGLERADSLVLDPHKWLYVGYEAGCLLVRRTGALPEAFHVLPDYLQDTAPQRGEVNFADYGLQLTRRARALKVWTSLKIHGLDAVRREVDRTLSLAEHAEERVRGHPELELSAAASLGIACFRWRGAGASGGAGSSGGAGAPGDTEAAADASRAETRPGGGGSGGGAAAGEAAADATDGDAAAEGAAVDEGSAPPAAGEARRDVDARLDRINRAAVERIQEAGRFMVSSTRLDGRYVIRLCPMNYRTRPGDVDAVLDEVAEVASRMARDVAGPGGEGAEDGA